MNVLDFSAQGNNKKRHLLSFSGELGSVFQIKMSSPLSSSERCLVLSQRECLINPKRALLTERGLLSLGQPGLVTRTQTLYPPCPLTHRSSSYPDPKHRPEPADRSPHCVPPSRPKSGPPVSLPAIPDPMLLKSVTCPFDPNLKRYIIQTNAKSVPLWGRGQLRLLRHQLMS